jgi:adenosine deaminase
LKAILEHGILATLNTDDPTISGIDLRYEYEVAAPRAGLTREEIRRAQANALQIAFLSEGEKEALQTRARARGRGQ